MEVFRKYHWPHNVRELRNTIARPVTFSDGPTIGLKDLYEECPELIESVQAAERELNGQGLTCRTPCQQARAIAEEHERQQLVKVLIKHDWNITRAAKELNTYQQYLSKRMKKLGIEKPLLKK
jgi:transcriptional regulator with GAF, ATPase, and Fis domain